MKRLALIHTVLFLADLFKKKLSQTYPDLVSFHVVDESILQELLRLDGLLTPGLIRRQAGQAELARLAGAEVILFTCSSTSPSVDQIRPLFDIPILKIDDPLAEKAVEIGENIGLICTARTTLGPSEKLLQAKASRQGKKIQIASRLESAAFAALMAGDKVRHDELVKTAAIELCRSCDCVVLAQASMAHLTDELEQTLAVPVLAAPELCVAALGPVLMD